MRILFKVLYEMSKPAMIRVQLTRPTLKKITKKVLNTNWLKKIRKLLKDFKKYLKYI